MIVTEELLAPHRGESRKVRISHRGAAYQRPLPPEMFTSTLDAFGWDYDDPSAPRDLALVLAFTNWAPVLDPSRQWLALEHQAGGLLCEQVGMIATRLTPRASILPALKTITEEGCDADDGRFSSSDLLASRLSWYFSHLESIGVDCECTWRHLRESFYPVDSTQENLNLIAEDAPNLDSIADWKGSLPHRSEPVIFFMIENSD